MSDKPIDASIQRCKPVLKFVAPLQVNLENLESIQELTESKNRRNTKFTATSVLTEIN